MRTQLLFSAVFLSQVLLLSVYLPSQLLARLRFVLRTYPSAQYPKLYPVSMDKVEKAQRNYRYANVFALLVGLAMVVAGLIWPGNELLNGENDFVPMIYLLLQFSPMMIIVLSGGFTYFNAMRNTDSSSTRSAELSRRRLFDFVSPVLVGAAAGAYFAFVALVIYVGQFDFPWFGGYTNIVIASAVNVFFAVVIYRAIYGKKKDPYKAYEDRAREMQITATMLVWTSIVVTVFISLVIALRALGVAEFQPVAMSLYFQLLALLSFRGFRVDDVNFDVYREDPVVT